MEKKDENVNFHPIVVKCVLLEYKDQLIAHNNTLKKLKRLRDEDINAVFPIVGMRKIFKKSGKKLLGIHPGILPDVRKYKQPVAVGGRSQCINFFRRCWKCQPDQAARFHENDDDTLSVINEDLKGVSEMHLSHEVFDKWKRPWTIRKMDLQENCHNIQAISKE
ncbi:hypothetical protein DMENIID0001_039760 [Sergentomyia squamirostris]